MLLYIAVFKVVAYPRYVPPPSQVQVYIAANRGYKDSPQKLSDGGGGCTSPRQNMMQSYCFLFSSPSYRISLAEGGLNTKQPTATSLWRHITAFLQLFALSPGTTVSWIMASLPPPPPLKQHKPQKSVCGSPAYACFLPVGLHLHNCITCSA